MKKFVKNTALIAFALVLVSITCNRSNTAMAESETVLYDMVWKIVNSKFLDQTNNGQDWNKWRHKYDDKIKTPEDAYVAIDTMIASLNDKYTRFVTPKEFELYMNNQVLRSIENRVSELENLYSLIKSTEISNDKFYDIALVSEFDKIIPAKNQIACHKYFNVPIKMLEFGHSPFFQYKSWDEIIKICL